jgi:hypothetical protein
MLLTGKYRRSAEAVFSKRCETMQPKFRTVSQIEETAAGKLQIA